MLHKENKYYEKVIKVLNKKKPIRLDHFLTNYFNIKNNKNTHTAEALLFSRNRIQKFIETGKILVNEIPVKQSYIVNNDDVIYVKVPLNFTGEFNVVPKDIYFEIVYFDKDIIIINKPINLVIHPAVGHYTDTLVNGLINIFPDLNNNKNITRYGIVHRLDKDTSGLLIIARNKLAQTTLLEQFKQRKVKKKYIAIVYGKIEQMEGVINTRLGRNPIDRKKRSVFLTEGKEAVTTYKVLEYLKNATLVELSPHTGRTHQLRVHMSYMKHPILGDKIYSRGKSKFHNLGLMLCAKEILFYHPITDEKIKFTIDLPDRFKIILLKGEI